MKVYNTLTRRKEEFKPVKGKKVNLFVCGPTVYDYSHIGHAKTYVNFDVIVRYLKYKGYKVFYLQNITDLDDKIINRAKEEDKEPPRLAKEFEKEYYQDIKNLDIKTVDKYARATDYIKDIISQVKRLMDKGYAYKISDGIYFDLSKFKGYGKLSGRKTEQAEDAVTRIDESIEKKNKGDFCLWKFSKEGEPVWKAEVGNGRPGWHIEDTAITEKFFGAQYDVHGGARDLIFPHHEAEIAQMEAISGKKPLVKYWLHTGFLNVKGSKMSKSLGNFITIRQALEKYDSKVLRFFFISTHYRSPIDFSDEILEQNKNALQRLNDFVVRLKNSKDKDDLVLIKEVKEDFIKKMDDDFNTPGALAVIFDFMSKVNKKGGGRRSYQLMLEFDKIFAVLDLKEKKVSKEIKDLVDKREEYRESKEWKKADEIRDRLKGKGVILEDTDKGVEVKFI